MPKKVISVRFDEQLREIINQEAQKRGMKPSDYIRETIKGGLKECEIPPTTRHIGMPNSESEDLEKRLEAKIKDFESKIAGAGKLPEVKEPEVEKAEITRSADEVEKTVKDAVKANEKQTEQYMCGECGYIDSKEFSPCPKCGNKLKW